MAVVRPSRLAALAPQDEAPRALLDLSHLILRCFRVSESLEGRTTFVQQGAYAQ